MEKTLLTESLENLSKFINIIITKDFTNYSDTEIIYLMNRLSCDVARLTASFKIRLLHIIEIAHNTEMDTEKIKNIDWNRMYKTINVTISYYNGKRSRYTIDSKLLNAKNEDIIKNKDLVVMLNK